MKVNIDVTGIHGEHFRITGENAGREGVWLNPEFVGLINAPFSTVWTSAADQIGGTFQDAKFPARDMTMPVTLLDSPLREWEAVYSRWTSAFSPFEDSVISVTTESGTRHIKCRMSETPELKLGQLGGHVQGRADMLMHLRAQDPLYYEEEVLTDAFRFNGTQWHGTVTVSNPTDMPMWLKWVSTGPASLLLPDYSFENREGFPGYEHRKRMITMPFQRYELDVVVDTDPLVEQVVASDGSQWWARMNGQFFNYPIPPRTPPTALPVAVNPLPWIPNVWRTLQIPFSIPTEFLYFAAQQMSTVMKPLEGKPLISWGPQDLAVKTDEALQLAFSLFKAEQAGEWLQEASRLLTRKTIGELIGQSWGHTWGRFNTMAGSGLQVRMERRWTSAFGMDVM